MQIRYSHHARQRMRERRVSEAQVEYILAQPDELTIGEQDEWTAICTIGDRRIQVVYGDLEQEAEETVLIYTVISVRVLR
ncbi:MAG: DUF4258 domain-containing protein [Caldilineaceae bacterium]